MKVINICYRTSIALHSSTLTGRYKSQCKQMWTFLHVYICETNICFQHGNQSYFLLSIAC